MRIKGNKPKGKKMIKKKQNKTTATKTIYKEKKSFRQDSNLQSYCTSHMKSALRRLCHMAAWWRHCIADTIASCIYKYKWANRVCKLLWFTLSVSLSRSVRYKIINVLRGPYGLCFARVNLRIESCFVLLLGCLVIHCKNYYCTLLLLSKFSDQGNISKREKNQK